MEFQQFFLSCLAHASYLIGSEGIAAVVDPQRDIGIYLDEAERRGLRIAYVIETHLHADFVSGHRELAAITGASIYVGAAAGARFPHVGVKDGDTLSLGTGHLTFLATPGHTLESICVLVTDLARSDEPLAVLTGDTLFIGDVGRPDLSGDRSPQDLAGMLYDSLHAKLLTLPDAVAVYPAHGAGSLCGRQMRPERSSTIGEERRSNYALRVAGRDEFVRLLTAELPERPSYFARDVEINRAGAAPLGELLPPAALRPGEVLTRQDQGALVLDTRAETDFGAAHVPGAVNIGLAGSYASWAGIVIGLDRDVVLVADDHERLRESQLRLARVGIDRVVGALADGMAAWTREDLPVEHVPQITVERLAALIDGDDVQTIDVRRSLEWEQGHVARAVHKPLNTLAAALRDLDPARPTAAYCKGGYRSSIATSLLQRAGFSDVMNVAGGFDAWLACRLPYALEKERSHV
ncbi:MAG: beta-lactamase domain protein [Candidatus Eremiobacteraeota bacterium]|nr:beta-lactamase domain protein [Candidatus Eremiobacteraeota bacterium]